MSEAENKDLVFRYIEDGKFAEQWGGPDDFDLFHQLGATLKPAD